MSNHASQTSIVPVTAASGTSQRSAAHRGPRGGGEGGQEGDVEADPRQVVMLRDMA